MLIKIRSNINIKYREIRFIYEPIIVETHN